MPDIIAYQAEYRNSAVAEVTPTWDEMARFLREEAAN
jgi:hypothetical protein